MKLSIRQTILQRRNRIPAHQWKQSSLQIHAHLRQWPVYQNARVVHIYVNKPQEVETKSIIHHCWQSGKTVIVPYLVPHSPVLGHSILSSFDQLITGTFDLQEPLPETRVPVDLASIDLVIMPGVVFDRKGGRIGHGRGHYDKFLSRIEAYLLGICFSFQIVPVLPQGSHDIPTDEILTEDGFIVNVD